MILTSVSGCALEAGSEYEYDTDLEQISERDEALMIGGSATLGYTCTTTMAGTECE